jgi:hypothetical protein
MRNKVTKKFETTGTTVSVTGSTPKGKVSSDVLAGHPQLFIDLHGDSKIRATLKVSVVYDAAMTGTAAAERMLVAALTEQYRMAMEELRESRKGRTPK